MANKFQEEIKTTSIETIEPDYNPLDEAVNEKKYSQANINTSGIDMSKPIDEPIFTPPPFQKKAPITNGGKPEEKVKREPINPEMKNLSKKEQDMAASQAAKMIIHGYEWMHQLGNKWIQVSDKKLSKLQAAGEINLNAMIDYDYGKQISAREFFQEYNTQVENLLTVSQEFKDEVTPILERVLSKRGIGMTDENMLLVLWGKDIAVKSMLIFQQKAVVKNMIENIKMASMMNQAPAPAPTPAPVPTPEPEPELYKRKPKTYEDTIDTQAEIDFEQKRNEEDEYIAKSRKKIQENA
jgi:hypothetical protein